MSMSKPEIVAVALMRLGGASRSIDTEDIAVEADRIAPGVFAWKKYPENIDKELVRHSLRHARLEKGLVEGSHDKGGWMLTPAGKALAEKVQGTELAGAGQTVSDSALRQERERLLSSDGFVAFSRQATDPVTVDEADSFFRLSPYMNQEARMRKILRITNLFSEDPALGPAISALTAIAEGGPR